MHKGLLLLSVIVFVGTLAVSIFVMQKNNHKGAIANAIEVLPRRNVYVGAWVEGFWDNDTKTLSAQKLRDFESQMGKKMALTNIYAEWEYLQDPRLLATLSEISANGWTPIISSNPSFFDDCKEVEASLYEAIARGDCDEFLRSVGRNLASYQRPVFLRFAWEMNLPQMYWSVTNVKSKPDDFVAAWKKFHTIVEEAGARNVIWILSFNTSSASTTPYKDLYPGDEYVDWVAIDGYNWGDSHSWSKWTNFNGVFRNSYNELLAVTDKKPVMLSEVNSAESGGNKADWLTDMLTKQIPESFTKVEAIIFFNENKTTGEKVDWRLEKSASYIKAINGGLDNDIYKSTYP
jgi:beta-mannanase